MINLEWVKDYIDISDQDLEKLAVKITEAGINVEKVITNKIDNLVIGEVKSCIDHPNSDHLHLCMVDVGKDELQQIVCGAPNVREGLKVIVALPGAVLPGDFEIKSSKIRGVESNGMICALYELGLEEKNDETYAKGIEELEDNAPVGKDPLVYLGLEDTLYELDIHKHRNNDCYYHIGFAYEISAILNRKVTLPDLSYKEDKDNINNHFKLEVETSKCPYYLAKMVTNVEIKESPDFIKRRLLSVGMRPINNVVDISNYVMLEFGQPLHFFDKDSLGDKILVRDAKDNEVITTLDEKMRTLRSSDIVITDGKKPVCIAGVMGGANTEVEPTTKNILIEAAIFDSVSIRYTASHLDLRSEASIRYGKGLSYEYTNMAINRACHLLEKYANATVLSGTVKHDEIDKTPKVVEFYPIDVDKMLGIKIDEDIMKHELERLDFPYTITDGKFSVTIPSRRLDIESNVNDIAEEIGRLYGYQNIKGTLPKIEVKRGDYVGDVKYRKAISKRLRSLGLNEVKTYTLVSPAMANSFDYEGKEKITLPNPMSIDKSVIRTSLIPSLLNTYNYNKARKVEDINIYEIAKTYDKSYNEESKIAFLMKGNYLTNPWKGSIKVDFYLMKGIAESILDYLGFKNRYSFVKSNVLDLHPGISADILLDRKRIGIMGRVHPKKCSDEVYVCELSLNALMTKVKPLKYKEASRYPTIIKDVAFIVPKEMSSSEVETVIKKAGGRLLSDIKIFDVYEKLDNDKKSIAYNLTFMDSNRTLTDEEVMSVFDNIIKKVTTILDVELRDK
ncbi:MAG TPA: phenylalanine--tRNA ligase subunit beta [Candidatus Onthousia faecipullorum]|uniref:Phenylalanine--tRNA ligase beta subunit n=1 Tax=Candidatus Onthousia faecipullorum TaxID=2840887 RepID=A0A9D1GC77_9FIRM|nr:phenylalanine--tRNA ligase subunit beta [Candidatus Onthousia faecipullorum]